MTFFPVAGAMKGMERNDWKVFFFFFFFFFLPPFFVRSFLSEADRGEIRRCWNAFCTSPSSETCNALLQVLWPGHNLWPSFVDPLALLASGRCKAAMLETPVLRSCDDETLERVLAFIRGGVNSMNRRVHDQRWDEPLLLDSLVLVCVLGMRLSNVSVFVSHGILLAVHELFEAASRLVVTLTNLPPDARVAAVTGGKDRLDDWSRFLAHVAAICLRHFSQIMFPVFCWHRSWIEGNVDELWSAPEEEDTECMTKAIQFGSSARSALAADMAIVARLRDWFAAAANLTGIAALRIVLVESVALLVFGPSVPPHVLASLRQQGLLTQVAGTLGWTAQDLDNEAIVTLHSTLQVIGFRAIATIAETSHENAMHLMQQLDIVSRAIDSILWLSHKEQARFASGSQEDGALFIEAAPDPLEVFREIAEAKALIGPPYVMPLPKRPRKGLMFSRLRPLFQAQLAFVFGCPQYPQQSLQAQRVEARSRVILSWLDLFGVENPALSANQVRARVALLTYPGVQLQAHVLDGIIEALSKPPELSVVVVSALRSRNVWEVLFSENFFRPANLRSSDSKELEDLVWGLLEHVGSSDTKNNRCEVAFVLPLLSRFTLRASSALECLFTCNSQATSAFDGAKLLHGVVEAMVKIRANEESVEDEEQEQRLVAVSRVLGFSFCLLQVREASETSASAASLLSRLLYVPQTRYLALDCVLTTLETGGERVLNLFEQYCQLLLNELEPFFVRALLSGVRRTVKRSASCKKMWQRVGFFEKVVVPILARTDAEEVELCCDFLSTLIVLQQGSGVARRDFAQLERFDLLLAPFLRKHGDSQIRPLLISMLLDGEDRLGFIRNPAVLTLLLDLWELLEKSAVLDSLLGLVVGVHHTNLAVCCASGVTSAVLTLLRASRDEQRVVRKLMLLLEKLVCHSVSPKELKMMFRLLRTSADGSNSTSISSSNSNNEVLRRPVWWENMVLLLRKSCRSPHYGPRFYLSVDGASPSSSAIVMAPFSWPRSGFAVSLWVYLESGGVTIFSFSNGQEGVELVCDAHGGLSYMTLATLETRSLGKLDFGVWVHLVLSHQNSGIIIGRSEVRLVLSGVSATPLVIPYPQCQTAEIALVGKGLCGRVGAVYVFESALSLQQACKIFSLGPSYNGVFFADPLGDVATAMDQDLLLSLGSSLIVALNSESRSDRTLLDAMQGPSASVGDNVFSCCCFSLDKSLTCIGGIACILPLLLQLTTPQAQFASTESLSVFEARSQIESVLALLVDLMKESERNQRDFVHCRGFSVVGYALRQWKSEWISRELVDQVFEFEAVLYVPELRTHFVEELLLNFAAWTVSEISVQMHFVSMLRQTYSGRSLRAIFGVQRLLDTIRMFYWESNSSQILSSKLALVRTSSSAEVLRGVRLELLRTLDFIIQPHLLEEDSAALLNFVVTCSEAALVHEVLHFLLIALSPENQGLFLRHICGFSGLIEALVVLVSSESEQVRVASMVLFSRLPILDNSEFLVRIGPPLLHAMSGRPLTVQLMAILLSVVVSRSKTMHANAFLKLAPNDDLPVGLLTTDPVIRNLAALDMLLGFPKIPVQAVLMMLRSLLTLLSLNDVNVEVVLMLPDWHVKLVRLFTLVECSEGGSGLGGGSEEASSLVLSSNAALAEVFQRLLMRVLRKDVNGVDLIRKTLACILFSGGGTNASSLNFSNTVLLGLCRVLLVECRGVVTRKAPAAVLQLYDRKRGNVVFPNICKLMLLVEEFVYYLSSSHDLENVLEECYRARPGWVTPRSGSESSATSSESDRESPVAQRRRGFSFSAPVANSSSSRAVSSFFKMEGQSSFSKNEPLAGTCLQVMMLLAVHPDSSWKMLASEAQHLQGAAALAYPRAGGPRRLCVRLSLDLVRASQNRSHVELALTCLTEKKMMLTQFPEDALLLVRVLKDRVASQDDMSDVVAPALQLLLRASLPMLAASAGKTLALPPASHWDLVLSSDVSVVLEEWKSPRWRTLVEYMEGKIASAQRDTSLALWAPIRAHFVTCVTDVASMLDQVAEARVAAAVDWAERKAECARQRGASEEARLELVRGRALEQLEKSSRRAQHLFDSLSRFRGPWASEQAGSENLRWKRDRFETESYLRPRMKLNRKFDAHNGVASSLFKPVVDIDLKALKGLVISKKENEESAQSTASLASDQPASLDVSADDVSTVASSAVDVVVSQAPVVATLSSAKMIDDDGASLLLDDSAKTILEVFCSLIKPIKKIDGSLRLTSSRLIFSSVEKKKLVWPVGDLLEMHFRRYLLRDSALEIKLTSHHGSILLNFGAVKDRSRVFQKIADLRPPRLMSREPLNPDMVLRNSRLTELWQNHAISNLDYLMHLNIIAGRTYNDFGQYPVFPWILSCYSQPTVHLEDPKSYRDLTKPVGALNPERLASFMDRFNSFVDPEIPPFMYGSHYSNSGSVLFYLVRMEPYTTYHLALQGGRFDHADRMFHSVQRAWENVLAISSDVKELTPEWFYQPEMFYNSNNFDLGYRQTGEALGDVVMPPWASNAEEFVRINRAALESDHVSANLHHWIDLIFGYKQRGEAAVAAKNVFFHLTYGGAVNWDAVSDPRDRIAIEDQIRHFGQVPAQLLRVPHVARKPRTIRPGGLLGAGACIGSGDPWITGKSTKLSLHELSSSSAAEEPIVFVASMVKNTVTSPEILACGPPSAVPSALLRFVTVSENRAAAVHQYTLDGSGSSSSSATLSSLVGNAGGGGSSSSLSVEVDAQWATRKALGPPLGRVSSLSWRCFAVSPWALISVGHLDNTAIVCAFDSSHDQLLQVQALVGHKDLVTAVDMDQEFVVTGSRDLTMLLWLIASGADGSVRFRVAESPRGVYYGHDAEIVCVCVTAKLDLVASVGADGSVLLHELVSRRLIRCLRTGSDFGTSLSPGKALLGAPCCADALVRTSSRGDVVVASRSRLSVFSLNGALLRSEESEERISSACISRSGEFVVIGSAEGITVRVVPTLVIVHRLRTASPVLSITLTADEHAILAALQNGKIVIVNGEFPTKRMK